MGNPFGDLISKGEGDYNSYNRGTYRDDTGRMRILAANKEIDFSQMTIAELQRRQALPITDADRVFAVGKYQLIPGTMSEVVNKVGINVDDKYNPELQERMFADGLIRIKRPNIYGYITGEEGVTLRDAQKAASLEWASVEDPDTPGHANARYEKMGNRMHTTAASIGEALDVMRNSYRAQIDRGMSSEDAWRAVTVGEAAPAQWRGVPYAIPELHSIGPGYRSAVVGTMQQNLNRLGITDAHASPLAADSDYGASTQAAVANFQRQSGMTPTGIADVSTQIAIQQHINLADSIRDIEQAGQQYRLHGARPDWMQTDEQGLPNYLQARSIPKPAQEAITDGLLKQGDRGTEVLALQASLIQLGINDRLKTPVEVNGVYGPETQGAVQSFQLWHGIGEANGIADRNTRDAVQQQASLAIQQRGIDQAQGLPAKDFAANVSLGASFDSRDAANLRDPNQGYSQSPQPLPPPVRQTVTAADYEKLGWAAPQEQSAQQPDQRAQQQAEELRREQQARQLHEWQTQQDQRMQEQARSKEDEKTRDDDARRERQPELRAFSDPKHPEYKLYVDLDQRVQAQGHQLPEDRLNQVTAELHKWNFKLGWPGPVDVTNDAIFVRDNDRFWSRSKVSLQEPAPSIQDTMQAVQKHDLDRAMEQQLSQQNQPSGPTHSR